MDASKFVADIVNTYNALGRAVGTNNELEVRLQGLDVKAFGDIYRAALADASFEPIGVECSINAISGNVYERGDRDRKSYVRKMTFSGRTRTGDEYYVKTQLARPARMHDHLEYTVNLSQETTSSRFDTTANALLRFKVRASWEFSARAAQMNVVGGAATATAHASATAHAPATAHALAPAPTPVPAPAPTTAHALAPAPSDSARWRLDMTMTHETSMRDVGREIENIRNAMFSPEGTSAFTIENLLDTIDRDTVDKYECELEWMGGPITAADIEAAVRAIATKVGDIGNIEYHNAIYDIARVLIDSKHMLPLFKRQHGLKQLLNQPIALNKNIYQSEIWPPDGYFVTDKADGVRCAVSIHEAQDGSRVCRLIADKLRTYTAHAPAPTPALALTPAHAPTHTHALTPASTPATGAGGNRLLTIADAELMIDNATGAERAHVFLFDVMMSGGVDVTNSGYGTRIENIDIAAADIAACLGDSGTCVAKRIVRLETGRLREGYDSVWEAAHPYTVDGLILTSPDADYRATRNYKWKPISHTTIDFTAVKCRPPLAGVAPYRAEPGHDLYLLFVGIGQSMRCRLGIDMLPGYKKLFDVPGEYYPVQFTPSINKYAYLYQHPQTLPDIDYKIVELRMAQPLAQAHVGGDDDAADVAPVPAPADPVAHTVAPRWEFVRVRTDRQYERNYYGNDYRVAEITYMNYVDPFTYADLIEPSAGYFAKRATEAYSAGNGYRRFVISVLIKRYLSGTEWVIDEFAGRGADLHRYQEVGVRNLLCMDADAAAIVKLVQLKFDLFTARAKKHAPRRRGGGGGGGGMGTCPSDWSATTVYTQVRDMRMPAPDLVADASTIVVPGTVDGIVCNFAIHYVTDSQANLRNLLRFNVSMLRVGGVFMFTAMDGSRVHDRLRGIKNGSVYSIADTEGGDAKYTIRRGYAGDKLAPYGQKIAVSLPFTEELVEESLVNTEKVITEAKRAGFELVVSESFGAHLAAFESANARVHGKLTTGDIEYASLYQYVVLKRIK